MLGTFSLQNPYHGTAERTRSVSESVELGERGKLCVQTMCLPNHHGDPNKSESGLSMNENPSFSPRFCKFIQLFQARRHEAMRLGTDEEKEISFVIVMNNSKSLRIFQSLEISWKRVESFFQWAFWHVQWIEIFHSDFDFHHSLNSPSFLISSSLPKMWTPVIVLIFIL